MIGPKVTQCSYEGIPVNRRYYATSFLLESIWFPVSSADFERKVAQINGVDRSRPSDHEEFWVDIKPDRNWEEVEPQIFAALREAYELPELEVVVRETASA